MSDLFATPWTVACQAPLSMGFSRQEYWSGLPFPSPGDLPDTGIEPRSLALQADALPSEPPGKSPFFPYWNFLQFGGLKSSGSLKFCWLTFGSKMWSERMWCYLLLLSLTLTVWPPEYCAKGILAYLTRDRVSDTQRWHNVIYDFCAWISFKKV